ncbi:MAG: hypothetical protein MJE63_27880 [Proteobacteria bacterium]|nr:hypothetical protein [Pseudomonadota bacterium]
MIKKRSRKELYDKFRQGAIPSGADFADFIRSQVNLLDDGINVSDNPEDPVAFNAKGDEENYVDFADADGNKRWRFAGLSEQDEEGLNLKADDKSRIFVERESGNVGIGTDAPQAKIHVKQIGGDDVVRIDDEGNDDTPFVITSDGSVGIGRGNANNRPQAKLHVNSPGAGDAIRVDDFSDDTTPFIVNEDGKVGIGEPQPKAKLTVMDGGISVGKNFNPGDNNIYVKGDIEIEGNIIVTGGQGKGTIEVDGEIKATGKDFEIHDNVHIMADPQNQAGSDGNLHVDGDTTLGTYGLGHVVTVNGDVESGKNPSSGDQQWEMSFNRVLTVNRNVDDDTFPEKEMVKVKGNSELGRTASDTAKLNATVSSDDGDVTVDDNVTITGKLSMGSQTNPEVSLDRKNDNLKIVGDTVVDGTVEIEGVMAATVDLIPPVGSIIAWHKNLPGTNQVLPAEWMECNGQEVTDPNSPYYGSNLPDLNNQAHFLRGATNSGDVQDGMIQSHNHTTQSAGNHNHSFSSAGNHGHNFSSDGSHRHNTGREGKRSRRGTGYINDYTKYHSCGETVYTSYAGYHGHGFKSDGAHGHGFKTDGNHNHTINNTGGSETRPINMSVVWIMRIK